MLALDLSSIVLVCGLTAFWSMFNPQQERANGFGSGTRCGYTVQGHSLAMRTSDQAGEMVHHASLILLHACG